MSHCVVVSVSVCDSYLLSFDPADSGPALLLAYVLSTCTSEILVVLDATSCSFHLDSKFSDASLASREATNVLQGSCGETYLTKL